MGSGCTTSSNSGLFQSGISDKGVKYTGPGIPSLGICNGDTLAEIEAVILQRLVDYATGQKICIEDIDLTACALFAEQEISCCESDCIELDTLMRIVFESLCTLYTDLTELQTAFDELNGNYIVGCLSGLGLNPTLKEIIQQLITQYCDLEDRVDTLETTVSTLSSTLNTTIGNFLLSAIQSCNSQVVKSGTGASATVTFKGFVPVGGVIPYAGSLTVFDSSGLGLTNTDACGWALCNGNNGTVNMSGLVPVGTGMGPAVITGMVLPYNTTGGEYAHILTTAEIPATSVSVSGSHTHNITGVSMCKSTSNVSNNAWVLDLATLDPGTCGVDSLVPPYNIPHTFTNKISSTTQTLTGNVAGGNGAHNNMPPYRALYYIQRIA